MAIGTLHTERVHDAVANLSIVAQLEIESFLFLVRRFLGEEIALKGGHLRLVEQGGVLATPQIEEIVDGILALVVGGVGLESGPDDHSDVVKEFMSLILLAIIQHHLFERTIGVEGHRGMEEQVVVDHGIHTSMAQHQADMAVELLTYIE